MITALKAIGVKDPPKNKVKLQEISKLHNLPTEYNQNVI